MLAGGVDLFTTAIFGEAWGRTRRSYTNASPRPMPDAASSDVQDYVDPLDGVADHVVESGADSVRGLWKPGVSVKTTCAPSVMRTA